MLTAIALGEVFDRRRLAGLAPLKRRVCAVVDLLAKLLGLAARS